MTASALTITSPTTQLPAPTSLTEVQAYANIFAESGMFADAKQMAQAATKILAGAELGVRPFAAMNGIHIIKGKTTIAAGLMATLIKCSPRYNYRVVEHTDLICRIVFYEMGESCGETSFSIEDARKAGLMGNTTWQNYPRNMTFARALSNGARWYTADIFGGPVYTPEEMGANVNGDGDVIDIPSTPVHHAQNEAQTQEIISTKPAPLSEQFKTRISSLPDTQDNDWLAILGMMYPEAEAGYTDEDYREALSLMDDALLSYIRAIRKRERRADAVKPAPLTVSEEDEPIDAVTEVSAPMSVVSAEDAERTLAALKG